MRNRCKLVRRIILALILLALILAGFFYYLKATYSTTIERNANYIADSATQTAKRVDDLLISAENSITAIAEKLEIINLQLAQRKLARQRALHWTFFAAGVIIAAVSVLLLAAGSPYLGWNYDDPETAVVGVGFHAFEWIYVRVASIVFIGAVAGFIATRRRQR